MALVIQFVCSSCDMQKTEIAYPSRTCADCRSKIDQIERHAHFEKLDMSPLEKRVRKIEEQLYNLNIEKRLAALESLNQKY